MKVLEIPTSLDHRSMDTLFGLTREAVGSEGEAVLLDARHLRWIDPVGMVSLLGLGVTIQREAGVRPRLQLAEGGDVVGYMARMGFFQEAIRVFDGLEGRPSRRAARSSDVLLELTPIAENRDIHALVERVQERAGAILSRTLRYPASSVVQFSVLLSEVCGNILEHAEAPGWVAAQTYTWSRRLGRQVLVVAVGDLGRGFLGSLTPEHAGRFGDRWNHATALEAAFIHGLTRFPDQGRGHGIQQMRRQVRRWNGFISMRSGTARIADVPDWESLPPLEDGLPLVPGAWITLILPATEPTGEAP
jgi:hypothetical protein